VGVALGHRPGGILSLLGQPRELWDALEADLLRAGFSLDDYPDRLSLTAIRSFWHWADPDHSAIGRLTRGEKAGWRHQEELLAVIVETLRDANWQRQGSKTAPKPKPLARPGVPVPGVQHFGDEPLSINEFERRMAQRRAA
jgi:hypothetical protein